MRIVMLLIISCFSTIGLADTVNHYMNISNQIPKMEMKADPKAQSWARSARTVLALTNETLAETLVQANEQATNQNKPIFCMPAGITLNGSVLGDIILKTYNEISSQQSDKDKMTVSQLAWIGVTKYYPCNKLNRDFNKENLNLDATQIF